MKKERTHAEIKKEIKDLQEIDNKTSDRVQHELNIMEEKEKEIEIEIVRKRKEYHKLKSSDLPIFKKRIWKHVNLDGGDDIIFDSWMYKLSIVNGRLLCQRIQMKADRPIELYIDSPESILDEELESSNVSEWTQSIAHLLTQLDSPEGSQDGLFSMILNQIKNLKVSLNSKDNE